MVPLMTASSGFEARIVAAHLGAEGIVWELRGGGVDGTYPLGPVTVLVSADELADARAVVACEDDVEGPGSVAVRTSRATEWYMGAGAVVLSGGFLVARLLSLD